MVYKYSSNNTLYLDDIDNFINNNLTLKKIVNKNKTNFYSFSNLLFIIVIFHKNAMERFIY